MAHRYHFLCSTLLTLAVLQGISAIIYEVVNGASKTPGGIRFDREISVPYTKQIMGTINNFIWNIFQQKTAIDRKNVAVVTVFIEEYKGAEAITSGENINVSSVYLQGYQGNVKWEFTSLLYHEMTHVFQWNGEGKAPVGLVEGIADYMILKANYYPPAFAKPGDGDRWDQGYDFTARFLEYCDGITSEFVAKLNAKMRYTYNDYFFVELTGKSVDQLWSEYKTKYEHP